MEVSGAAGDSIVRGRDCGCGEGLRKRYAESKRSANISSVDLCVIIFFLQAGLGGTGTGVEVVPFPLKRFSGRSPTRPPLFLFPSCDGLGSYSMNWTCVDIVADRDSGHALGIMNSNRWFELLAGCRCKSKL